MGFGFILFFIGFKTIWIEVKELPDGLCTDTMEWFISYCMIACDTPITILGVYLHVRRLKKYIRDVSHGSMEVDGIDQSIKETIWVCIIASTIAASSTFTLCLLYVFVQDFVSPATANLFLSDGPLVDVAINSICVCCTFGGSCVFTFRTHRQ